jgi:hypothetical protein
MCFDATIRDSGTIGVPLTDGAVFRGGVGFGGGYGRVCEMLCPHLSGPLPKSLKKFREFSEQNRNHQKFFAVLEALTH